MEYFKRKWAYLARRRESLPPGYRRVEYLESSGTQFIDAGYVVTTDDAEARMEFALTSAYTFGNASFVFGARDFNGQTIFSCSFPSSTEARLPSGRNSFTNYTIASVGGGGRKTLVYGNGFLLVDGNNYAVANYPVGATNETTLYVFGRKSFDSSASLTSGIRCFSFVIIQGGTMVRRLVPCERIADGKPGMYDLCGSTCELTNSPFYINAGTGEFTYA